MLRMDLDEVFSKLCEFGSYQRKVFYTIAGLQIFMACQIVHNVYMGAEPDFVCERGGGQGSVVKCGEPTDQCQSYTFTGNDFTSVVSEFNLVCADSYKANLIQSFLMGGFLTGSLIFGWVADRTGRRVSTYLTIAGMATFSAIGGMAQSYTVYLTLRFIVGIFTGGFSLVSFVLVTEIIGSTKRGLASMVMPFVFAVGIMIYSALAFYVRNWRVLTFITSSPGLVAIYMYFMLPESPRWLYTQGRLREAERVVEMFIEADSGNAPKESVHLKEPESQSSGPVRQDSLLSLIVHPELRKRTFISVIAWFVNCAVYYGLTMSSGSLGGNMYISVAMSGFVEIPAYVLGAYIINRFGRRHSITWTMVSGGIACLVILTLPENADLQKTISALLGKMCISVSFSVAWCYSAELYPTSIRNQGMSVCNMSARLGGVISPMLIQLSHAYPSVDYLIFGSLSFIAGILCLRLPETLNQQMAETVSDLDRARSPVKVTNLPDDKIKLLEEEIQANNQGSDYEI